jgi:bifunctional non-homologous end joining protein LigD
MLPGAAAAPWARPGYCFEPRWEGLRLLLGLEDGRWHARSSTGQDVSPWLPELAAARRAAEPRWVLLDGEAILCADGRPCPARLQERLRGLPPGAPRTGEAVRFMAYDILRIGDSWLLDVAWEERREILQQAVCAQGVVGLSPTFPEEDPAFAWAAALGLEGVLARRTRGRYLPGERTREWVSLRPAETRDLLVCGWLPEQLPPGWEAPLCTAHAPGAVVLGGYREGRLEYAGVTGAGLRGAALRWLEALSREGAATPPCPFSQPPPLPQEPRWLHAPAACRVRHAGYTPEGILRHPTVVGPVPHVPPANCRLEPSATVGR